MEEATPFSLLKVCPPFHLCCSLLSTIVVGGGHAWFETT